ncbi:hypothetical protein NNA36_07200 [Shimia sp. CNT1-13L.2]|nr:hypothetical protein [Shimia sp. CNT1-13L.2]
MLIDNAFDPRYAIETLQYGVAADGTLDLTTVTPPVHGTLGDDRVYGQQETYGGRNESLYGFAGNDTLYGYDGNDTLDGGLGNDTLYGAEGNDTYIVGEGHDYISDYDTSKLGVDVIVLPAGVAPGDVSYNRVNGDDLLISWPNGSVQIANAFEDNYRVETLRFNDGTEVDLTTLAAPTIGTAASEGLYGNTDPSGSRDDLMQGEGGNDTLYGYDGNDTLNGGDGNDTLYGEAGGDTYVVSAGNDFVRDYGTVGDPADTLLFGPGVTASDLSFSLLDNRYLLIDWGGGIVTVDYWTTDRYKIETARFHDGSTLDLSTITPTPITSTSGQTFYGDATNNSLTGTAGNDRFYGYEGNDTLDGAAGNDTFYGAAGNDRMIVGNGHNYIDDSGLATDTADIAVLPVTQAEVDIYRRPDGDLIITWAGGSLVINLAYTEIRAVETLEFSDGSTIDLRTFAVETRGTGGNDRVYGNRETHGATDETLVGKEGNDSLYGYEGADTLIGGEGNDSLYGDDGADVYRVGEGHDYIDDNGLATDGADVIELPAGVVPGDVTFTRLNDGDLLIDWGFGSVRIDNAFDLNSAVETLRYANGTTVDLTTLAVETHGTLVNETLRGNREENGSRNDTLRGFEGNDILYGYDGNDDLIGGPGNDTLYGESGGDNYRIDINGHDYISDYTTVDGDGDDTIFLPVGVSPSDVTFTRLKDGDLVIAWSTGSVRINEAFDTRYHVEKLTFANGTTQNIADLTFVTEGTHAGESIYGNREAFGSRDDSMKGRDGNDALYGYDGDDSLAGGNGNDSMYGADGEDTYYVGPGDDYISDVGVVGENDTIVLPFGVKPSDVTMIRRSNDDVEIMWEGGSVYVDYMFDERYGIETLQFRNGTTWDLTSLQLETHGSGNNETLNGNRQEFGSRDDFIFGFAGNDVLNGHDGADTLVGGLGNDSLYGGVDADTYRVGQGHDYISDYSASGETSDDVIKLLNGINKSDATLSRMLDGDLLVEWNGGSVRVNNAFDERYDIARIDWANGASTDVRTLEIATMGTGGSERVYGNRELYGSRNDSLVAKDGNDSLYGYDGNDTLLGGLGDDFVYGGADNDVYVAGSGSDVFDEQGYGGDDTILFRNVASASDLTIQRSGTYDLAISWSGGDILVRNHFYRDDYRIETVTLSDGSTFDLL